MKKMHWMLVVFFIMNMMIGCGSDKESTAQNPNDGPEVKNTIATLNEPYHTETPPDEFQYEIVDGEIIITGYRGVARDIVIPHEIDGRPVTAIGEDAFFEYDLISIVIPEGVREIGATAFRFCVCLENVVLPESLERIETAAFHSCESLEEILLPSSLQYIGDQSFDGCNLLEELVIPYNTQMREYGGYLLPPVDGDPTRLVLSEGSVALEQTESYHWDLEYHNCIVR